MDYVVFVCVMWRVTVAAAVTAGAGCGERDPWQLGPLLKKSLLKMSSHTHHLTFIMVVKLD